MADPWNPIYKTIDETAIAALDEIYPISRSAKVEYAVAIYEDKKTLLYGFTDFVTSNNIASVTLVAPPGSDFVANGHTHPTTPKEVFIQGGKKVVALPHRISTHVNTSQGLPAYWIAPNGTVHVYEPSKKQRRIVRTHYHRPNIVH